MRDDVAIQAIRDAQDDCITRAQVLHCGGTDEWIEAQLAAGRWVRMGRKVFRATTGEPTRRQRERAALLCAGPEAALSHHTAAARFGLRSRYDGPIHTTVRYGRSADPHPGVVIHRSRAFAHLVIDTEDLPTVSAADTCIDLAVLEPEARRAMRTLLHAALAMKVPAQRLLTRRPSSAHVRLGRGRRRSVRRGRARRGAAPPARLAGPERHRPLPMPGRVTPVRAFPCLDTETHAQDVSRT
ncbi:MAG TPA: hypothetical protein VGH76_15620 [Actinomycetospora sp.]|jgi:hypothetical protein|uniref:hypothetical protein n=1 Tax=Actinomycetospora sp. TaxID=1872135 RepID=UPI002F3E9F2C